MSAGVTQDVVAALAEALGLPLAAERVAGVAEQLTAQLAGRGGLPAEELEGVEPAIVFDPRWEG